MTPPSSATAFHPRPDDHGKPVKIKCPTTPSPSETWKDPTAATVFVPDGPVPSVLNGVPMGATQPPSDAAGWAKLVEDGCGVTPPMPKSWKKVSAGAVIIEPDGRVWLFEPTNHFAGYHRTFPKGTLEHGYSL